MSEHRTHPPKSARKKKKRARREKKASQRMAQMIVLLRADQAMSQSPPLDPPGYVDGEPDWTMTDEEWEEYFPPPLDKKQRGENEPPKKSE